MGFENCKLIFMFDLLNLNPGAFGLDISDRSLKLAEVKKQGDKLKLSVLSQSFLAPGVIERGEVQDTRKLGLAVKNLVSQTKGLTTRHVVVSMPEEKSFLRVMQMPKMKRKELKSAIPFEAANYIPFSVDKVYLGSQLITPIARKADQIEVLLAALAKTTVDPYVEALRQAKLVPVAFETESQATARAVISSHKTARPVFIIDIGATCTNFSTFFGYSLRFASFIPDSSDQFTLAISKALKVDRKEAERLKKAHGLEKVVGVGKKVFDVLTPLVTDFVNQIEKHIDYYQTHSKHEEIFVQGKEVRKILIWGGGANLKGLAKFLSDETGLIVKKADPVVNIPERAGNIKSLSKKNLLPFATAIGLALRNHD